MIDKKWTDAVVYLRCVSDTLSGPSPGEVWLHSHEGTAEFSSDFINNLGGFKAVYRAANITDLSSELL